MKNKIKTVSKIVSSIGFLLAASSSTVLAQNQYFTSEVLPYFRVDSGWAQFLKTTAPLSVASVNLKSVPNPVVGAGLGLGVNFGDNVRADITWTRHLTPVLKSDNVNHSITRSPLIDAYFLNIYYEIGTSLHVFNPYIGAGAGVALIKDKLLYKELSNNTHQIATYSELIPRKNNFAYKFIIGSAFVLNEKVKFDLSYNYHDYGKSKSKTGVLNKQFGKTHYRSHIISAGLRFGL